MVLCVWISAAAASLVGSVIVEADLPKPDSAIVQLEAYTKTFANCVLRYEEKLYVTNQRYSNQHAWTHTIRTARNGERWRYSCENSRYSPVQGKQKTGEWKRAREEYLYDGARKYMLYRDLGGEGSVQAWTEVPNEERRAVLSGLSCLTELRAGHNDFRPLCDIFRESTVTVRREPSAEGELIVLESVGKWGRHAVWMDPARGHVPVKFAQEKTSKDWIASGRTMETRIVYAYGQTRSVKNTVVATATKIEPRGGRHIVTEYTVVDRDELNNGKTITITTEGRVTGVELSPSFAPNEFTVHTDLPDGSLAFVNNEPGIRYEWQGGELVKVLNPDGVRSGERFLQGKWTSRVAILLAVFILGAATVFVARWRRKREPA